MQRGLPLDAIDSRTVLRLYAFVVGPVGFMVFGWGPMWLGGPLNGQSWGVGSITRVAGACVMASALCAYASSLIENPVDRRRWLGWFLIAHAVVLAISLTQMHAVWGDAARSEVRWAFVSFLFVTAVLYGGWIRHGGDAAPLAHYWGWFGTPPPGASTLLESAYRDQMREAGAQEERHRLARDLHDSVKQQIFAIQTAAATAETRLDDDPINARRALAQVRASARESMAEMDAMLDHLRTTVVENAGLVDALRRQCEALAFRTGARVDFDTTPPLPASEALPPGAHQTLLRVAQEALSNVARHARATDVRVTLAASARSIDLTVSDNGQGYDTGDVRRGMGSENMRERMRAIGGSLQTTSRPGEGTTVTAWIPLLVEAPSVYLKRAFWPGVTATGMVLVFARDPSHTAYLPFAVLMFLDSARYVAAWRRAQRMHVAAA